MIQVPSIVSQLIERLEAGEDPTPAELRRALQLQALHTAKAGEDYLRESIEREDLADDALAQALGAK